MGFEGLCYMDVDVLWAKGHKRSGMRNSPSD